MVHSSIIWVGPGLTQVFAEEHFESSNNWKKKQVVLSQTVQYGPSTKHTPCGGTVRMAEIIVDDSGPQQCQKVDVSQNVNIVLLYNR